ncbi:unnamed protein product [Ixodes pacificus]
MDAADRLFPLPQGSSSHQRAGFPRQWPVPRRVRSRNCQAQGQVGAHQDAPALGHRAQKSYGKVPLYMQESKGHIHIIVLSHSPIFGIRVSGRKARRLFRSVSTW